MPDPILQSLPIADERVSLAHANEIELWIQRLEVSEADLREAVDAVGNAAERVRAYLKRR